MSGVEAVLERQREAHISDDADNQPGAASLAGASAPAVVPLTPARAAEWDAFVARTPAGLPQHQSGWQQVLTQAYGYETHFVMAVDAGRDQAIRGVLPLFLLPSPLGGATLSTTPGGLCAADAAAAAALIRHAQGFAREQGVKSLVLHDSRTPHPGLSAVARHEAHLLDLGAGHDGVWQKLDRNIRRQVRMAERNEVVVEIDRTGARVDDFYAVMSRFTHQVGTPIFPRRFLDAVIEAFPQEIQLAVAYHGDEPVGGYFQLALGDTLYGAWGATLGHALNLRTVYLAYWSIMADAMAHGFQTLDMGRSPVDSNASRYKAQWGGATVPVYQQAWQTDGQLPTATLSTQAQDDGRFRLVRTVWPRLPYGVATWLGPRIRRFVPFG